MYDVADCQKVSNARGSLAGVVVEDNSEVKHIPNQWLQCMNTSSNFLIPSLSPIPFVGFPDKVLGKVHIFDLGLWIGCVVGNDGYELCALSILLGHIGFLTFFEGDILFSFNVDSEGLNCWMLGSDVKLRQSTAGLTGSNRSEILVSLLLVVFILELSLGPV